jgi:mRNA-degrading endonuclease RelE of RelBE toxin-antitoxin system
MYFVETSFFTKRVHELLTDEELRLLQLRLAVQPDAGDVIKQSGGIRKLRWSGSGRGKRGGTRIIYYYVNAEEKIFMLYVYSKSEADDLTPKQIKLLKSIIDED